MEKTFEGQIYEDVPELDESSCGGCDAYWNPNLCEMLGAAKPCQANRIIWKEKVIPIVPVQDTKNKYEIAAELFTEWREGTSLIEFTEWCNQKADPEYAEYQRLKSKFEGK
jgi:hypothetical protein